MTFKRLLLKMFNAFIITRLNYSKVGSCALFVALGFCIGVALNYYGLLFEAIHVEVRVITENASHLPPTVPTDVYVVPNIVHFVWFAPDNQKPLSFINYLSIKSAHKIQRPEAILLHFNFLPAGEWWERLLREVPITLVHKVAPEEIHGQKISHAFHKGDVAKLEILVEYGGIYLDYDVIVLNSLDPVRKFDATLGKEKPPKFIAGIIIGRKDALFLRLVYESYRDNYRWFDWDYNCARVAYQIYLAKPDLLHVEPYKFTTPDWADRTLLWDRVIDWKDLYLIHVMGHALKTEFTPDSIKQLNTTFGQITRFIYYGRPDIIEV